LVLVMAHARRPPQDKAPASSISSPSTTRRNTLRRPYTRHPSNASPEFVSSPLLKADRPVLVPLQPNLRRLPSRIHLSQKNVVTNQLMRESSHVITGSKRKRVVSSNENAHNHGRPTRGSGRLKRLRVGHMSNFYQTATSDESPSEASEMEVDQSSVQEVDSDELSVPETPLEDPEEHEDSCAFLNLFCNTSILMYI